MMQSSTNQREYISIITGAIIVILIMLSVWGKIAKLKTAL